MRLLVGCLILLLPAPLAAQHAATDTTPAAVVQRFVDGANARDIAAMVATLAEDVVFASLPTAQPFAIGRDSVEAFYARRFTRTPTDFTVTIASRIVDGAYVVDFEKFTRSGKAQGQATWVYLVRGGRIQQAWSMRQP